MADSLTPKPAGPSDAKAPVSIPVPKDGQVYGGAGTKRSRARIDAIKVV